MNSDVIFRVDAVQKLCKGKKVLNLGFLQHADWKQKVNSDLWLHGRIQAVADELVGIDYLAKEVAEYNRIYETKNIVGDVTKLQELDLDSSYDVIVCGELIEHIDNPGLMLSGLKGIMNENTLLIITTPNPWASRWVKMAYQGYEGSKFLNKEHVCWYSYHTLRQLLERNGYKEYDYTYYYAHSSSRASYRPVREFVKRMLSPVLKGVYAVPAKPLEKQAGLFFVAKAG